MDISITSPDTNHQILQQPTTPATSPSGVATAPKYDLAAFIFSSISSALEMGAFS
jgi:hypothetical protein